MSKFAVVVFPDETQAYEGVRALRALDVEGSLEVHGIAVLTRDAEGRLAVKQVSDKGALGMGVGALVGGLIGLIGGPVGLAVGMAGGAAVGATGDLLGAGVSARFVRQVSEKLMPGSTAVVAEVDEEWTTPLDSRMDALGQSVLREWRADFEDDYYMAQLNAFKADLARMEADFERADQEGRAKMRARLDRARAKLQAAAGMAEDWLEREQEETNADIQALMERADKAKADARAAIERRIAALREERVRRTDLLAEARELAKESDRLTMEALKP